MTIAGFSARLSAQSSVTEISRRKVMQAKWTKRRATACWILAAVALHVWQPSSAQTTYPSRPIKIIVPVPPGGTADILPRLVAEKLGARFGQPVVVENRPGAALDLAAAAVSKAAPDGYTLLATPPGPLVSNQFLHAHLGFDPKAFVPVTMLAESPFLLVAQSQLPVSNLAEFIDYAKNHPGKLTFASSGVGSPPHLAMEMLQWKSGIRFVHVPYKGLTPALLDVVSGQVDMMFHDPASTMPQITAGRLKVLAVGSATRLKELPNVGAIAELIPGYTASTWYGVVAPPGMPREAAAKLSTAMAEILRSPDIAKRFAELSVTTVGSSPNEFSAFLLAETARLHDLVDAIGLKPE